MAIYLIQSTFAYEPYDPVRDWYGPLNPILECDWGFREEYEPGSFRFAPEIEWPSCRHHRRPDWVHTCFRPPRAAPRGMRLTLEDLPSSTGNAPTGILGVPLLCYDDDPITAAPNVANYDINDGASRRTQWKLSTSVGQHSTLADPLDYVPADFIMRVDARYREAGKRWRLFRAPPGYAGEFPVPNVEIPSLAIARRALGGDPANKDRSIVLWNEEGSCQAAGRQPLPFVWYPGAADDDTDWFDLPTTGRLVMEAKVQATGGPIQLASVLGFQITSPGLLASTISWQLAPPPPVPQQYTLFQTFHAPYHTGISATANDILRMEYDNGSPQRDPSVSWWINGTFQHTFENVSPWSECFSLARWLHGGSTSRLAWVKFWVEPV